MTAKGALSIGSHSLKSLYLQRMCRFQLEHSRIIVSELDYSIHARNLGTMGDYIFDGIPALFCLTAASVANITFAMQSCKFLLPFFLVYALIIPEYLYQCSYSLNWEMEFIVAIRLTVQYP